VLLINFQRHVSRSEKTSQQSRRCTQRVLLQIPILVCAHFAGDDPITEETTTFEVNAHGGLIALAMKVRPGQKLVLKNWPPATNSSAASSTSAKSLSARAKLASRFRLPCPKFWNADFLPPDWTPYLE